MGGGGVHFENYLQYFIFVQNPEIFFFQDFRNIMRFGVNRWPNLNSLTSINVINFKIKIYVFYFNKIFSIADFVK